MAQLEPKLRELPALYNLFSVIVVASKLANLSALISVNVSLPVEVSTSAVERL